MDQKLLNCIHTIELFGSDLFGEEMNQAAPYLKKLKEDAGLRNDLLYKVIPIFLSQYNCTEALEKVDEVYQKHTFTEEELDNCIAFLEEQMNKLQRKIDAVKGKKEETIDFITKMAGYISLFTIVYRKK